MEEIPVAQVAVGDTVQLRNARTDTFMTEGIVQAVNQVQGGHMLDILRPGHDDPDQWIVDHRAPRWRVLRKVVTAAAGQGDTGTVTAAAVRAVGSSRRRKQTRRRRVVRRLVRTRSARLRR